MDEQPVKQARERLRRISGQIDGITKMLDEERDRPDILVQLASARAGLANTAKLILAQHVECCLVETLRSSDEAERQKKIAELLEMLTRFGGT